jgi:hypothetical protein
MTTRSVITAVVFLMTNAVAFGVGIVPVLLIPALAENAFTLIPAVVIASIAVALPLAWIIAPRLQPCHWKPRSHLSLVKR